MADFAERDVLTVARAVADPDNWIESAGDCDPWCLFCSARARWPLKAQDLRHELSCPVLVARDLLTGFDL